MYKGMQFTLMLHVYTHMLDWFRGEIPFLHDALPAGRVLSIEADGSMEWESTKKLTCRSSHETSLKVRSVGGDGYGMATDLQIDGNLAKFLQGHNLFGSRNLNALLLESFLRIYDQFRDHLNGWSSPEITVEKIKRGDYRVNMVDINQLYDLGNDASVEAWLHAAEMRARTRSGRSSRDKGTVYMQKNSRRWAFKFYNKLREMAARGKTHLLPEHLQNQGLEEFASGKLRAELRLMSLQLKDLDITHGRHLTEERIGELFDEYLRRIDMKAQATIVDEQLERLPRCVQASYQLWRQGALLREMLPKPTFYRHRKLLMEEGVDISVPPVSPDASNVIPLIRVVEAVPVGIPQTFIDRGMVACL